MAKKDDKRLAATLLAVSFLPKQPGLSLLMGRDSAEIFWFTNCGLRGPINLYRCAQFLLECAVRGDAALVVK